MKSFSYVFNGLFVLGLLLISGLNSVAQAQFFSGLPTFTGEGEFTLRQGQSIQLNNRAIISLNKRDAGTPSGFSDYFFDVYSDDSSFVTRTDGISLANKVEISDGLPSNIIIRVTGGGSSTVSDDWYVEVDVNSYSTSNRTIEFTKPNVFNEFAIGDVIKFEWNTENEDSLIDMKMWEEGNPSNVYSVYSRKGPPHGFIWPIPSYISPGRYFFEISLSDFPTVRDVSDSPISIISAASANRSISLIGLNDGENHEFGSQIVVEWEYSGSYPNDAFVQVYLDQGNRNKGYFGHVPLRDKKRTVTLSSVGGCSSAGGNTVPPGNNYKIRVQSFQQWTMSCGELFDDNGEPTDTLTWNSMSYGMSEKPFAITQNGVIPTESDTSNQTIELKHPDTSQSRVVGEKMTIRWDAPSNIGKVKLMLQAQFKDCTAASDVYCRDVFPRFWIVAETENDGAYDWEVGDILSSTVDLIKGKYRVEVFGLGSDLWDQGESFTILRQEDVPNQSPTFVAHPGIIRPAVVGVPYELQFGAGDNNNDPVAWTIDWGEGRSVDSCTEVLKKKDDYRSTWTNFKTITWSKPGTYSYTVTISDCRGGNATKTFTIPVLEAGATSPGSLHIKSPNGGETWYIGEDYQIIWEARNLDGETVDIEILNSSCSANCPIDGSLKKIVAGIDANAISFKWVIPDTFNPRSDYKIQISSKTSSVFAFDSSDSLFTISNSVSAENDSQKSLAVECLADGTLIKTPNDPKIYIVENCKRRWIETLQEFQREGHKFEDVQDVDPTVVDKLEDIKKAVAQIKEAVAELVRAANDERVYRVIQGKRLWIPTADVFNRQRLDWGAVQETSTAAVNNIPTVRLVRTIGDKKVYYLTGGGQKRHVPTADVFESYGNSWEDVLDVDPDIVNAYKDNELIRHIGQEKVFKLEGGKKRWIKTGEAFAREKFKWEDVGLVNDIELESYPDGAPIE